MGVGSSPKYGNSNLFAGALGVVKIGFKGYDLGLTTSDAEIKIEEDLKDIIAQQKGTKAYDQYRTGEVLTLEAILTEVDTGLLSVLFDTRIKTAKGSSDNGAFVPSLMNSLRTNESGVLKIAPIVGGATKVSSLEQDEMFFYEAQITINGSLINWGADSQRAVPIKFTIYPHDVSDDSSTYELAYGYWGDPDDNDLPEATWEDASIMQVDSIHITSETEAYVAYSNTIDTVGNFATLVILDKGTGLFITPTAVEIDAVNPKKANYTFPASSFTAGYYDYYGFVSAGGATDADGNSNDEVTNSQVYNDAT